MMPIYNPYHFMYFRGNIVVAFDGSPVSVNDKVMRTDGEYVSNGYVRKRWRDEYGCTSISCYNSEYAARQQAEIWNEIHNQKEKSKYEDYVHQQEQKVLHRKQRNAKIFSVIKTILRWGE